MKPPRRVVILGCAGSGKSTLARAIGARLSLPVIHLDALFWEPGWVECETAEFQRRVAAAHAGDAWVSDGNYSTKTWPIRVPRADLVLRLHQPRWRCLARALTRALANWGRTRADIGAGCPEKIDWPFLVFIWNWKKTEARHARALARFAIGDRLVELHGDRGVRAFLRRLPA